MALNPGQQTTLSVRFTMPTVDMAGFHDFRIHLISNDPNQPDMELVMLSNWVQ